MTWKKVILILTPTGGLNLEPVRVPTRIQESELPIFVQNAPEYHRFKLMISANTMLTLVLLQ